ncbi:MAG: hypothetical protein K0Q71_5071 [Thermomicrobiales bacterium]|jgi:hypothetical protein|nr:hypothetical protein [Thermomicrobiales bacterium]
MRGVKLILRSDQHVADGADGGFAAGLDRDGLKQQA